MSPQTKTALLLGAVIVGSVFIIPRSTGALEPRQPIEPGEYQIMGTVVHSQQFGQEMLAIGGYLQHRVQVIVDPEVRQSIPRTPYTNTECLAYVSRATDKATGNILEENQVQARFRVIMGKNLYLVEPDRLNLEQGYAAVEGTRFALTPIQTRAGSVTRYEWCLEPNKEYTLAIFKFTSTIPPGPEGKVRYTSSYQFAFTDLLPEEALARLEECPPHHIRDEVSGACIRPVTSTTNAVPPETQVWIAVWAVRGLLASLLVLGIIWFWKRYRKK